MTCTTCGAALEPTAMFCGECGTKTVRTASQSFEIPPPSISNAPPAPETPAWASPTVPVTPIAASAFAPPAQPAPVRLAPAREPEFISAIPEQLTAPPPPAPLAPAPARFEPVEDDDVDETIIAPRRGRPWTITGPDGVDHAIRVSTVIGRSPARPLQFPEAELLALVDESKSLSKSHALLEPDGDVLVIVDLHSTNGVIIVEPSGAETLVPAGQRFPLERGAVLELGDYKLVVGHG